MKSIDVVQTGFQKKDAFGAQSLYRFGCACENEIPFVYCQASIKVTPTAVGDVNALKCRRTFICTK